MRAFAQKPKTTRQTTSTKTTHPGPAFREQHRSVHPLLPLQRTIGNLPMQRLPQFNPENAEASSASSTSTGVAHAFSQIPVHASGRSNTQAKLKVNTPRDRYEQAAERVADQVMRQELAKDLKGQEIAIQAKTPQQVGDGESELNVGLQKDLSHSKSSGSPLPLMTRRFFETRMLHDFGGVRIHTDNEAGRMNEQLGARAFTHGQDVYFAPGEYAPHTAQGKRLIAHELAHVLQQRGNWIQRQDGGDSEAIDRSWLIERIGFRMNLAFTKYVDAASEHQRALRKAVADQEAMAKVVLDVLLAFAAPGLGRFVGRVVERGVRPEASLASYRLALSVMDRSDQIVAASTAVGKAAAVKGFKNAVAREESEQFVQALKQHFSVVLDRIHASLPSRTDEELAFLYVNYDPEIATSKHYENQIGLLVRRYRAQVAPIGEGRYEASQAHVLQTENHAYWIELPSGTYLGLIETPETTSSGVPKTLRFIAWIDESMHDLAIEKTRRVTGRDPKHVSASEVHGIP